MKMLRHNGPLQENYLRTIEQYLEINFPKDFRNFLLKYNGGESREKVFLYQGNPDDGSIADRFFGFVPNKYENILVYYKNYKDRIPNNMFPIGCDPGGNLILIAVKMADRGKIYFWDHEMEADEGEVPDYSNLTLIADNFDEFFDSLFEEKEVQ